MWPALLLCFFLIAGGGLFAQYTTASLGGTITDSTGAIAPGAEVTVRNVATGFIQSHNDASGAFLFSHLPVGVRVDRQEAGFSAYVQAGITLTVNQSANQNVTLQVGRSRNVSTWRRMPNWS